MPILDRSGVDATEMYPGFKRRSMVDGERGSTQLSVSEVVMEAGSAPPLRGSAQRWAVHIGLANRRLKWRTSRKGSNRCTVVIFFPPGSSARWPSILLAALSAGDVTIQS